MVSALKNVNTKVTHQREQARPDQIKNNEGGYVFAASDKSRLERFLILGTDGGTYYATEKKITGENVRFLRDLIVRDERLVRETLVNVSVEGRAYKNSPALFALALLFVDGKDKAAARNAVLKVARTSTHLFEFAQYIENLGGWGRAKRSAVADWYQSREVDDLAYQMVKYRQRDGWTHRDLLRLSHPVGLDTNLVNFALGKQHEVGPRIVSGFEIVQAATDEQQVLNALSSFKNLPWETIPTQYLKSDKVWKALFYNGQLRGQALVRNITRLARIGAFDDMVFAKDYADKLQDVDMMIATRLHPINYLNALVNYSEGQINRSYGYGGRTKDWKDTGVITDALNEGFHLSFKAVTPANMRTMLGVDVSSSMGWSNALGIDLTPSQISAAMAMVIARTEPYYEINAFSHQFVDLGISAKTNLTTAMRKVTGLTFGGTDCALPMKHALKNNIAVDTFVVLTDSETHSGSKHPFQALKEYRDKTGINARLAVIAATSTGFTIADPTDRGAMDFCGFDADTPKILSDFSAGRI